MLADEGKYFILSKDGRRVRKVSDGGGEAESVALRAEAKSEREHLTLFKLNGGNWEIYFDFDLKYPIGASDLAADELLRIKEGRKWEIYQQETGKEGSHGLYLLSAHGSSGLFWTYNTGIDEISLQPPRKDMEGQLWRIEE
ncbi:hypothetical protein RHS03_06406, partial [Rhizoctonia solani]